MERDNELQLNNTLTPLPKSFVSSLSIFSPVVIETTILKCIQCIFPIWLLHGEEVDLYTSKSESTSPKDALCQVWLKLAQWFCRKEDKFTRITNNK